MTMSRRVLLWIGFALLGGCSFDTQEIDEIGQNAATRFLTGVADSGYARVNESRPFSFPGDHASHPEYRSEWWYFTGNLASEEGHQYGFELTFFRFALAPAVVERRSEWGTNQAWMAHLSLTDENQNRFVATERFSREALGLAGSTLGPFKLHIEDWSAESGGSELFPLRLRAADEDGEIDLTLVPLKGPVAQGEDGFDRKGPEDGNASHYYSFTRLRTEGQFRVGDQEVSVTGLSWMDREWGTSALSDDLDGWDWFSLQLSDGRDLMYYRLRTSDGETSPFSGGSIVDTEGNRTALAADDVSLQILDYWQSDVTGSRYPVSWSLSIPKWQLGLEVRPLIQHQELDLAVRYWEGAIIAEGTELSPDVNGRGYLELTGY